MVRWVLVAVFVLCGCAGPVGTAPSVSRGATDPGPVADKILGEAGRRCREARPTAAAAACAFRLMRIEAPGQPPNAFLTQGADGRPVIVVTEALVAAASPDELAFVIGHEAAHQIADHPRRVREAALRSVDAVARLTAGEAGEPDAPARGRAGLVPGGGGDARTTDSSPSWSDPVPGRKDARGDAGQEDPVLPEAPPASLPGVALRTDGGAPALDLRGLEIEADALGAELARAAGFDPRIGAAILTRGLLGPAAVAGAASHPSTRARHEALRRTLHSPV